MRQYSAAEFKRGRDGVERFIRTLRAVGFIRPSTARSDGYAVLDAEGDIIGDYDVPHSRAFAYIKRKLNLRVETESEDWRQMNHG